MRCDLRELIDRVLTGAIEPGTVLDFARPLGHAAAGDEAKDRRRAITVLLAR